MRPALLAALLLATTSGISLAGDASDKAKAHFEAIAAGNVAQITANYADNAVFQWVGGPLDGVYASPAAIKEVWTKFANAQGKLALDIKSIDEAVNPKGATITANVVFKGKSPIPLRYVLLYRDGKLANEVWQINPPKQ